MQIELNTETEARLNRAAADAGTSPAEWVRQLVENHLDYDAWFRERVSRSLEQLDTHEYLTHEEVWARMEAKFSR